MLKNIAKKGLSILGYSLHKKKVSKKQVQIVPTKWFSMHGALERCVARGIQVNTVIDVGASDGRWSRECMKSIPNANYLLVEAQTGHEDGLKKFKKDIEKGDFILAAAGKEKGSIYFDNGDLFGGLASETPLEENCIEVPVIRLDEEVEKRNLKGPYLLKLDTHGFEVPILEGAIQLLKEASLVIIETYNYKLTNNSLRYFEMCTYMETLGFSPIEMVDFMERKYDNTFWQMDTFFIPSNSKEFSYNSYI